MERHIQPCREERRRTGYDDVHFLEGKDGEEREEHEDDVGEDLFRRTALRNEIGPAPDHVDAVDLLPLTPAVFVSGVYLARGQFRRRRNDRYVVTFLGPDLRHAACARGECVAFRLIK